MKALLRLLLTSLLLTSLLTTLGVSTLALADSPAYSLERGARTLALDRHMHRLYLPTAQFGPQASAGADARPTILPGTFEILVVQAR